MWVLDTDTYSLWFRGNRVVTERIQSCDLAELAITVVTVEEIFAGWHALIRRSRHDEDIARAYRGLRRAAESFRLMTILGFEANEIRRFQALRASLRRVGTNDLRIAAITLENEATLVTRNLRDFQQVPDIRLEDWSRGEESLDR